MKKLSLILAGLAIGFFQTESFAQKNKDTQTTTTSSTNTSVETLFQTQKQVYRSALRYQDRSAAKNALYQMMALKPQETNYRDSLAVLFFQGGEYASSVLVTNEILNERATDTLATEIRAASLRNLGFYKESLKEYEKMYEMSKKPYFLYEIAGLQFQLKRYTESQTSLANLIKSPDAKNQQIALNSEVMREQVPMVAAAFNMLGVLSAEQNQHDNARKYYQEAIKLFPNFVLANSNLAALERKEKEKGTTGTETKTTTTGTGTKGTTTTGTGTNKGTTTTGKGGK